MAQDHDDAHAHLHADDDNGPGHGHEHTGGVRGWMTGLFHPHSHDAADSVDAALESSARGIRAVKISLLGLAITAALQLLVVLSSGSVALLADTIHNLSYALTAIPLWIAFALGRRAATRRYTYCYGRAEDRKASFEAGFDDHWVKPVSFEMLSAVSSPSPQGSSSPPASSSRA